MIGSKIVGKKVRGTRCTDKLISMIIILMLSLAALAPLLNNVAYAAEFEAGADPNFFQTSTVLSIDKLIAPVFSSESESEYNYVSHVFTVADVIFFSYVDGTMLALYDSLGTLIWNNGGNPLDKGGHAHVAVPQGVYTACGSEKFAVLTGDPITRYVLGYYAMDQNGYGVSTELYTWVPQLYGHCSFIIFAYEDDTQVAVDETDTGINIATFTLNKGQHWQIETLQSKWLHITANHPVSALTCYDQGYLVPSANGRWSGTEFYTYVSDVQGWPEDLTVISYNDDTLVTIKDSNTGSTVWSGEVDEGQAHVESFPSGANRFFAITSSKSVTVAVQPWVAMTSGYHQGLYVGDSTGTRLGTDLIGSTLNGGYLYILAYKDNTNVVVYNSRTGEFVNSYTLNDGDYVEANPGNGLWRIMSNYPISAYSGWGQWNAEFAPIEFRMITAINVDISLDKGLHELFDAILYNPNELITIATRVTDAEGDPLYPLGESEFKVFVDGSKVSVEEFRRFSATDYEIKTKAPGTPGDYTITVKVITKVGEGVDTQSIIVPQGRKALVVGITEYEYPLFGIYEPGKLDPYWQNEMAKYFESLGFDVIEDIDQNNDDGNVITYDDVSEDIKKLVDSLNPNDVAAIYISSHGADMFFGKYWLCYGDDMYSEDAMFPGDTRHVTGQLKVSGIPLDFLWLHTCESWAYQDEINNLGAGGIIFFGADGSTYDGNQDDFYNAILGERYVEDTIDNINDKYKFKMYDQYSEKMDLLNPLLKHRSPSVYVLGPEEFDQPSNETFAVADYVGWDSDGDGLNDAATIFWDANTVLSEEDVMVKADIYNSGHEIVRSYIYGPYTIYGDSPDTASFGFYSSTTDTYNVRLLLYNASANLANVAFIPDLSLNSGAGGPGGDEEFTSSWSDTIDSNGDGVRDTIRVSWTANTTLPEEDVSVLALVHGKVFRYGPYAIYGSQPNEGNIELHVGDIGTYEVSLYLVDSSSELEDYDFLEVPLETTIFTEDYSDYGVDTNGDGKYENLIVDVGINVITAGNYILRGSLYDQTGNPIITTAISTYLTEGVKKTQLNFDGQAIHKSGINGPYELRYLALYKDEESIGHRNRPYTTSAYDYTEFQPPLAVLDADLETPLEVLLDSTFHVTLSVSNPSDHVLTNLQASLGLTSEFDTTESRDVDIGNLEAGQTKKLEWELKAISPGYGEITVSITSPEIQSVSATRGIVITHFPLSVKTDKKTYLTGDNVIITTTTTNENPEVSYIDLLVNLTLEGPSVKETYSMPIDFISSLETRNFALTWDSTGKPFGNYIVTAELLENTVVLNETSTSFTLTTTDNIPPTTFLTIGEPKHLDLTGNTYVSSATPFTLAAEDNPGGSGVASTFYRVYNITYDTGSLEYSGPFYLAGLSDGEYSIDYCSTDNVGNTEATNTTTVILESIYAVISFDPHVLNLKSKGQWFTARIEIPANYHVGNYTASDIDLNSLRLNQTIPVDPTAPITIGDYDGNGILDLMAKFNRTAVSELILAQGIMTGNVTLTITGQLNDGTPFEGTASIAVRMPGDINMDGYVNVGDAIQLGASFATRPGEARWNPAADENEDGYINVKDVILIGMNFGKTYL